MASFARRLLCPSPAALDASANTLAGCGATRAWEGLIANCYSVWGVERLPSPVSLVLALEGDQGHSLASCHLLGTHWEVSALQALSHQPPKNTRSKADTSVQIGAS